MTVGSSERVKQGDLLWTPRKEFVDSSNLKDFEAWLESNLGVSFSDYNELRQWSVEDSESFWLALWKYFDIQSDTPCYQVVSGNEMENTTWFTGTRVNYAEHLLRYEKNAKPNEVAIYHCSEKDALKTISWAELGRRVKVLATQLISMDVRPGDCVVSYMPNIPATTIAMLATMSVGAIWSSAAPEFGSKAVIDRFSQIKPKVLFAADGYRFGGRSFNKVNDVQSIVDALGSLEHVIWLDNIGAEEKLSGPNVLDYKTLQEDLTVSIDDFRFRRVKEDHPLWVVFSSGTTGLPKAIVHSHVGMLLEHMKMMHFHMNLKPKDVMFFYTTTGWIMFNVLVAAFCTGCAIVQYDGDPTFPEVDFLWGLAAEAGVTSFGASPAYIQLMEKQGVSPAKRFDLSKLESMLVSGSPASPENFQWCYDNIKKDLWLTSQSGGTEIGSAFVGAIPTLPIYAGEIQTRCLGMDVRSWDSNGQDIQDDIGELVCLKSFPSMPLYFWGDENGQRYKDAYFNEFPGVWRHGDFITITNRGSCVISGRSDSTLNRFGVRIGTSEIYNVLESINGIDDSIIVCCELPDGKFFMPAFVQLTEDAVLDDELKKTISVQLREECSPRHVPDEIFEAHEIPYTLSGKKMEVPLRKILMGESVEKSISFGAMKNPSSISFYSALAKKLKLSIGAEYGEETCVVEKQSS